MAYKVFVSHGSADAWFVDNTIAPMLRTSGAEIFVDRGEIQFGDDYRSRLISELTVSDELFVLLTPTSIERPWVFAEIGATIVSSKRVVPVRYGPRDDQLQTLGVFSLLGSVALLELPDVDAYVQQLAQRVQERLNG